MIRVVIGAAEQAVAFELRGALAEMDGVETVYVVDSTTDLAPVVVRLDPDIVLVHDSLGPEPVLPVLRDLALRRPASATLLVTSDPAVDIGAVFEAGARGVVSYPIVFEQLRSRIESAGEYAASLRRMFSTSAGAGDGAKGRAAVLALVGAKGGVGTTTVATHLALDAVRQDPDRAVLLIDLDLEKGDVPGILEVRHRASVADVAKVADDLAARAVADAVVVHATGLQLLLAPTDLRDVEAVTPIALREIMAVIRQEYDLVIVDGGSHVTPAQAALVELADEVVAVTTPDVASLRGLRRSISQWEGLAVRKEADVRVLLNRLSRNTSVSAETVRQLTRAPVMNVGLPAAFRRLEAAINSRDPLEMREPGWWQSIRRIGEELASRPTAAGADDPRAGRRRSRLRGGADDGSVAIENVAILPMAITMVLLAWQLAVFGMSSVWSGHAANAAARAHALHLDPVQAARDAVPGGVASGLVVSTSGGSVTVSVAVPLVAPGVGTLPARITTTRTVVEEP